MGLLNCFSRLLYWPTLGFMSSGHRSLPRNCLHSVIANHYCTEITLGQLQIQ